MRRRTVLIPVLTLATLTTAFSWWLWRELPLRPVRRIVLPMCFRGTITVTNNDRFCHLSSAVLNSLLDSDVWQCLVNLETEEIMLGPGGLKTTEIGLSKSQPVAYMRLGSLQGPFSYQGDGDCYALNLITWNRHQVIPEATVPESGPFSTDVDYHYNESNADPTTRQWKLLLSESDRWSQSRFIRMLPDEYFPTGTLVHIVDPAANADAGCIWLQGYAPARPFVSETGLIWCLENGDSDDQCVIAAYDPRVRPVPFWLWAVTAACVVSVAAAATWGRGRRK